MSATTVRPLSRRHRKALARRQWVVDLDQRHAILQGRLPINVRAVSICSCGRTSWVMDGATDAELNEFYTDADDHAAWCADLGADT